MNVRLAATAVVVAALGAGAVLLPWSDNEFTGAYPAYDAGPIALFCAAATIAAILTLPARLPLPAAPGTGGERRGPFTGRSVLGRRGRSIAGGLAALAGLVAVLRYAMSLSERFVWSIGRDAAGNDIEDVAHFHPAAGLWCAAALCLGLLAAHTVIALRRGAGQRER